jgi:two-component system, chemotaxis family, sensor kinase CheA
MVQDEDIREFLIESNENLANLDRQLVELEDRPDDTNLIAEVFRTVHTIKGTSGFFGFDKLGGITHVAENILSQLRERQRELTPEMASLILESIDAVKEILVNIEATGGEGDNAYPDLRARLEAAHRGETHAPAAAQTTSQETLPPQVIAETPSEPISESSAPFVPAAVLPAEIAAPSYVEAAAPPPAPRSKVDESVSTGSNLADSTIRVDVHLLDKLMNLVGELVLARNQLIQDTSSESSNHLSGTSQRLNLITTELQEGVMKMRMQPIGVVWNKLPRVVRDLASECGKKIQMEMEGAETELDKTIIEAIKDPLTHIVRNSCDHGIESPDVRMQRGKSGAGKILLRAYHEGGHVNIEISDDGGGIDIDRVKAKARDKGLMRPEQLAQMSEREATQLIFLPGFSTAAKITNISGRGVGMDVVKTNIEKIGGTVDVYNNPHAGTTVRIKIPLTLAIIPGLLVTVDGSVPNDAESTSEDAIEAGRVQKQRFVIPQANLLELVRIEGEEKLTQVQDIHGTPVYQHRGRLLPLVYLNRVLGLTRPVESSDVMNIVVLQVEDRQLGLVVDHISDTQEIVVKPLGKELKGLDCYVGATIMGDGKVALILDAAGIARLAGIGPRSRETTQTENDSSEEARRMVQRLLIFCAGRYKRLAVPLALVARLEEFPVSRIERASGRPVLHYRGQILPLVHLESALNGSSANDFGEEGSILVIVFSDGTRTMGLVVDQILDITEDSINVSRPSTTSGLLGSALVADALTDFVDVHALVKFTGDDWFKSAGSLKSKSPSVLLVEPSLVVREMVRSFLEISGYRVHESVTVQDAVNKLARSSVDAVVTTLDREQIDGWELLREMRGNDRLKHIPVIGLAADAGADFRTNHDGLEIEHIQHAADRAGLLQSIGTLIRKSENELAIAG